MSHPTDLEGLSRPIQPIPVFVLVALKKQGLEVSYSERPAYQRNDYLSWINRAVVVVPLIIPQKRFCRKLNIVLDLAL